MGANHSNTRKLTVDNDDPTSVIKVSDDVVQRIKNSQASPEPVPPQSVPNTIIEQPTYIYEPSVTTLQLRQTNAAELKKNDEYWQNRIKNLQSNHKKINEVMEQEYAKAVQELEGKKVKSSAKQHLPPCQNCKEAVLQCYQEHCNEPMRCAKVVQAFQDCVDLKRSALIANRG